MIEINQARGLEAEPEVSEYIKSLPKNSIYYDLGACVGGFALQALHNGLEVIAFEVESQNYNKLVENYQDNLDKWPKNHKFKSFQIGIADKECEVDLRIGQSGPGGHHRTLDLSTYCASEDIIGDYKEKVKADSLDNIIKKNNLPQPNYIKVDIDGSEYAFVIGAKKTLKKTRSIIIELYKDNKYYNMIIAELTKL